MSSYPKPPFNVRNRMPHVLPIPAYQLPTGTTFIVMAHPRPNLAPVRRTISIIAPIGTGTFGRVYKARLDNSQQVVAVKQVAYDTPYQDREPCLLHCMEEHGNIVNFLMHSYVQLGTPRMSYIFLVMEYMPMSLLDFLSMDRDNRVPLIYVRVLSYQIFRGLAHLYSLTICHRDIKPDNILIDPATMILKLSDFGSAKLIKEKETSATYVCSHLYRAPELFAKIEVYDTAVDIWSAGCILAEMLQKRPLFKHNKNPLLHMACILGTEGLENCPEVTAKINFPGQLPKIARLSWQSLIGDWVPDDMAELINACLMFEPDKRIAAMSAVAHASYDELRTMDALKKRMPNGVKLPQLFNFSERELDIDLDLWMHILPLKFTDI